MLTCWPPAPRRAIRVDAELGLVDLDVCFVAEQRADDHLCERRVAAVRLVERRQTHEPVHAAFCLERAVRVLAADAERRRLQPGFLTRARLEQLGLEPSIVGPAEVHAQHHLGPVLRVGAARAADDRHDSVALVVLAVEERLLLETLELTLQRRYRLRDLRAELAVHLQQLARIVVLAAQPCVAVETLRQPRLLRRDPGGALLVVPEAGLAHLLLQLGDARRQRSPGQR